MSSSKYVAPRRKKRVFCTQEAPFPVPIATITAEPASADQWFYYTAYLTGKNIIVRHSGDIDFLYKMGFFGKGNLSRSQPEFNHRFRTVRIPHPTDTATIIQPRVVSHRVYKNHIAWSGKDENTNEKPSDISDTSEDDEGSSVAPNMQEKTDIRVENVKENDSKEMFQSGNSCENCSDDVKPGDKASDHMEWVEDGDFWSSSAPAVKNSEEMWAGEGNAEFWGVKDEGGAGAEGGGGGSGAGVEGGGGGSGAGVEGGSWGGGGGVHCCKDGVQKDYKSQNTVDNEHLNSTKDLNMEDCDTERKHVHSEELSMNEKNEQNKTKPFCNMTNTQTDKLSCDNFTKIPDEKLSNTTNTKTGTASSEQSTVEDHREIPELETAKPQCHHDDQMSRPDEKCHDGAGDTDDCDILCRDDDVHGDILVIADSDDESKKKRKSRRKRWRPVLKKDPHPVIEHLQLSVEEAFFLSYGLGCLVVIDETQAQLNLSSLWQRFFSFRTDFLQNYIAYHYYRSQGWVPKPGLKFGCDFIVYKEGPPFYHASYSVVVRMVDQETLTEDPSVSHRNMSWISLSGLNRITEHVAKELVLCYVIKPRGITEAELTSPACIPRFKVQEILVSRWISSQERQEKADEEFP